MFNAIQKNLDSFLEASGKNLSFNGVDSNVFIYLFIKLLSKIQKSNTVMVAQNNEKAQQLYNSLKDSVSNDVFALYGLDVDPCTNTIPSTTDLAYTFSTLYNLSNKQKSSIIITTPEALSLYYPPVEFFEESQLILNTSDIISPYDLALKLTEIGYLKTEVVESSGQFSQRGEIVDIFISNAKVIRLTYFDDMIESIQKIDPETLRTINDSHYDSFAIPATPTIVSNKKFHQALRANIPQAAPNQKEKFSARKQLFERLSDEYLFDRFPLFFPLFFKKQASLFDFISTDSLFIFLNKEQSLNESESFIEAINEDYEEYQNNDSSFLVPNPELLFLNDVKSNLSQFSTLSFNDLVFTDSNFQEESTIDLKFFSTKSYFTGETNQNPDVMDKHLYICSLLNIIKKIIDRNGIVDICYKYENSKKEISFLLDENQIDSTKINFTKLDLASGFFYKNENTFVLSESDFFSRKVKKTKKTNNSLDLFAEQIATLKKGDHVIHKEHGVGVYEGLETLEIGGNTTDFLTIQYKDKDKVYVPVYKLNLVQKHSDATSQVSIASLKSNKFQKEKAKVKNSVKKLAFDLLELQAKRKTEQGHSFAAPDHLFHEFELSFPFEETPDQKNAIDDVLSDMQAIKPMDRLVCGDVGFGKTEIAMRASFLAVANSKQVALLVPTTVLAYQHYKSFIKRFENFPVNIQFLSRFKTTTEELKIREQLQEGKIDIIIGTHKLLSEKIKYQDLGLLIIDEEHRFGVGHKEKLKNLKTNLDCLTLTATPIPRTLQLSFLGIRDLSIIKTAPPRRQSIKTYLVKNDMNTIKKALNYELKRGGQAFIVHNRVSDIEEYATKIQKLCPAAKIVIAHGQMTEKELEKRITSFFDRKFDVLLSTTIIESGIDIPSANTMIIDRADMFGLAQLHQLRGRIGRSNKKAYAYFMIPENKTLSIQASQRLRALQTYAEMGSGFNLASSDMEIRGSGDILGAEQSGHIQQIGLELYMELLEETIASLKNESVSIQNKIEIQTPFDAFIPHQYINDSRYRLKYYKKISNSKTISGLNTIKDELEDLFGIMSSELNNLFVLVEARIILGKLPIKSLRVSKSSILVSFSQELIDSNEEIKNKILNLFLARPKVYKLNPNYTVKCLFKEDITQTVLLDFAKYIATQLDSSPSTE